MRARLYGAVALVAAALCASGAAPAWAAACHKPPEPGSVAVNVAEPAVEFDHSLSKPELAKLAATELGHGHGKGGTVFGLTAGQLRSQLEIRTQLEKRRDGVYCGWPARVTATVGYEGPIAVHVAAEHPKGTCQHRAILGHEMKHVTVFKEALRDYETRLRKALERALAKGKFPVTGRDREAVQAEVGKRFEAAFTRAVAEAESERDRRNARLDTRESYRRTRDLCDSW